MTLYYEFNTSNGVHYAIYDKSLEDYPMKEYYTNEPCYIFMQYGEEYLVFPNKNIKYIIGKYDETTKYNYKVLTEEEFMKKVNNNKRSI